MIYGKQQVQVIRDDTDLIGIRVLVLSQLWQPSLSDPMAALAESPEPPAVPGGVLLVGEQTQPSQGAMRTTWTFQGIKGDGKRVTFKDRKNSIEYGFDPGFAQIPIQLHPQFQTLLDNYGGYASSDGSRVIWPSSVPAGATSGATGWPNSSNSPKTKGNPMFGVEDWFRMEGTYRFRYASFTPPDSRLSGTIVQTSDLPGRPPNVTSDRNWLFVPPHYQQKGIITDITETYWLSGPGGWPKPVYSKASLGANNEYALVVSTLL